MLILWLNQKTVKTATLQLNGKLYTNQERRSVEISWTIH